MIFRSLLILTTVLLMGAGPAPAQVSRPALAYVVTPEMKDGVLSALAIDVRFTGDADGETRVYLPHAYGGETELWRWIGDIRVEGASMREDGPATRVLTHKPGARLHVRYRVISAFDRDLKLSDHEHSYRPVLRPDWFSVLGYAALIEPEDRASSPTTLRFGPLPRGWKAASDAEGRRGRVLSLDEVRRSVLIGGPGLKVITRGTATAPLRVAALGHWDFDLDAFADMLSRVVSAQRDYWKAEPEPYLVTLTPLTPEPGSKSYGGTGMGDAFAIYAGTDTPLPDLRWLVAHEHLHSWNPDRLGGLEQGEAEHGGYWFSEGFTDFLADRTLLRSGVWSLEEFTTAFNESLRDYAQSPVVTEPNSRIVADFWNRGDVQRLPYLRGLMLAMLWDKALADAAPGHDLDDVLQLQQSMAAASEGRPAADLFPLAYRQAGGRDLGPEIERYVVRGERVLLPADLFGACAVVHTDTVPAFDRGFDASATERNGLVVTGIDPAGPAFAAGLRDGMKILKKVAGRAGDASTDYAYQVDDHGTVREIRYRPVGRGVLQVQRMELTPGLDAAARADCARRMSGG